MDTHSFIQKANQVHNNVYNYSKTVYTNSSTKVIITCNKHGDFTKIPNKHISTGQGCPLCSKEPINRISTYTKAVIDKFSDITIISTYIPNSDAVIEASCKIHGVFTSTVSNILKSDYGCKKCGEAAAAASKRKSIDHFITKAKAIHGDKYIYTKSIYTSAKEKITITCPHHGDFEQLVSGHLSGYGCKHCASHGKGRVDMNKPCTLYYLHLKDIDYYKIGITSLSIEHRYRTTFDKEQFDIVFTKQFSTGREAYNIEQELLSKYTHLIHTGPKLLKTGNTEIFTEDIFKGDYSEYTN